MPKKSLLRDAIALVQPNKPLKLPKNPTFTPPKVPLGSNVTGDENLPQDEKGTYPKDQKSTQGENITPEKIVTQGEIGTYPEGEEVTQDTKGTYPPDEPTAKPRLTQTEKTAEAVANLRKGFTRFPNSILMEMIHGNLSKAEMKILLLIARFTISFNDRKTAALSKASIEQYTKLQGKSILEALANLEEKKLIIKIKGDQYTANQLGLCFDREPVQPKDGPPSAPKEPKTTEGKNSPQDEKGTYPEDQKSTHPEGEKGTHFKVFSSKSSFKESLSNEVTPAPEMAPAEVAPAQPVVTAPTVAPVAVATPTPEPAPAPIQVVTPTSPFPEDMTARWKEFEKTGDWGKAKKEREIFKKLSHKPEFPETCGQVVAFLEANGTGKAGDDSKVHCPMLYLENHWEHNLARFRSWQQAENKQKQREEQARKALADKAQKEREEQSELAYAEAQKKQALAQFAQTFAAEPDRKAFVEEALTTAKMPFLMTSWSRMGWESPIVQSFVLHHFEEVQAGRKFSSTYAKTQEASA